MSGTLELPAAGGPSFPPLGPEKSAGSDLARAVGEGHPTGAVTSVEGHNHRSVQQAGESIPCPHSLLNSHLLPLLPLGPSQQKPRCRRSWRMPSPQLSRKENTESGTARADRIFRTLKMSTRLTPGESTDPISRKPSNPRWLFMSLAFRKNHVKYFTCF